MKRTAEPVPCLCGCATRLRRSRSFPLCRAAVDLVYERTALLPLPDGYADPRQVRSNRVWQSESIVVALVRGDIAEAVRLLAEIHERRARRVLVGA